MLVQLIKNTNYKGFKRAGEFLDVSNDIARRWFKNNIAVVAEEVKIPVVETTKLSDNEPVYTEIEQIEDVIPVDEEVERDLPETTALDSMNAKELYKLCCEKGLEVEPKRSKEYYLELLTTP